MLTVKIFNYDTKELLFQTKIRKFTRMTDLTPVINEANQKSNVLSLGTMAMVTGLGIKSWCTTNGIIDSYGGKMEPDYVTVWKDGEKIPTTLRLGIVIYPNGYVLNTGKESVNIFGGRKKMYLKMIGRANVICRSISDCHVFPTLKNLQDYIRKHEKALHYLVQEYGYQFSVEFANDLFREDVAGNLPDNPFTDVNELLGPINTVTEDSDTDLIPENPTEEDVQNEAIRRMEKAGLWDCIISEFQKSGKVFQSEAGGIIYDLNSEAMTAITEVQKEFSCMPYHVIVTRTTIGIMYTVLFVSKNSTQWPEERIQRDGTVLAYVYNASYPDYSEIGLVQVQAANGGMVRLS